MLRITGWARVLSPVVEGREVIPEGELLDFLVESGRAIGPDWVKVLAHCMRALGFRLRRRSRTYIKKVAATDGGAS